MDDIIMIDYSEQLQELITNQQTTIELLQKQIEILLEMINGFTMITNMLYTLVGILVVIIAFFILWKVIFSWFFRGTDLV